MDTVVLDGVEYVKASALAKKFRYTQDYIGQLCRAKKVDARLVGRTWFVNPGSIKEHKLNKHKLSRTAKKTNPDIPKEKKLPRKEVLPVIQNKTTKTATNIPIEVEGVRIKKLTVAYELDDETLIPQLTRKKTGPPKTIRIEPANAKKLRVTGEKVISSFEAGELPQVSLSGKLKIVPFAAPEPEIEPIHEPQLNSDPEEVFPETDSPNSDIQNNNINILKTSKLESENVKLDIVETDLVSPSSLKKDLANDARRPQIHTSTKLRSNPMGIRPKTQAPQTLPVSTFVPLQQAEKEVPTLVLISPLIATILALVCVLLIFSANASVVIFDSVSEFDFIFQVENLLEFFSH
ncbi:MAG: hypothetical protein ACI9BF_000147 [Candidatus Paceibacteria bacterium]|jgi:hypothetical protein